MIQKVLVTGGAGFIGSHTVDRLLALGYQVRILDNLCAPVHAQPIPPNYISPDCEFVLGDINDRAALEKALQGVDAVIHLAAYQDYLPFFAQFFQVNTVGTALLYEVIIEKRLPIQKVVLASSQAVYGEAKYLRADGRFAYPALRPETQLQRGQWEPIDSDSHYPLYPVWTDEAQVQPHNQYALSKYTQELIALNLGQRYHIPTVCMRYSIVQGARQSFRNAYSGILRIFTQQLLAGQPPLCYEDGQQLRDYVAVQDVATANCLVLSDTRADFEVFNVGGNRQVTVVEYAQLLAERTNRPPDIQLPGYYRFGDTRHVFSDISKLGALGWSPEISLPDVMDDYLNWATRQPDFGNYSQQAQREMQALGTLRPVLQAL